MSHERLKKIGSGIRHEFQVFLGKDMSPEGRQKALSRAAELSPTQIEQMSLAAELQLLQKLTDGTEPGKYTHALANQLKHIQTSPKYFHEVKILRGKKFATSLHILNALPDENEQFHDEAGETELIYYSSNICQVSDALTVRLSAKTEKKQVEILTFCNLSLRTRREELAELLRARGFQVTAADIETFKIPNTRPVDQSFSFTVPGTRQQPALSYLFKRHIIESDRAVDPAAGPLVADGTQTDSQVSEPEVASQTAPQAESQLAYFYCYKEFARQNKMGTPVPRLPKLIFQHT